jgi:hypothetical protein
MNSTGIRVSRITFIDRVIKRIRETRIQEEGEYRKGLGRIDFVSLFLFFDKSESSLFVDLLLDY